MLAPVFAIAGTAPATSGTCDQVLYWPVKMARRDCVDRLVMALVGAVVGSTTKVNTSPLIKVQVFSSVSSCASVGCPCPGMASTLMTWFVPVPSGAAVLSPSE